MAFFNTKHISLQRISPTPYLEIDRETTLVYYIIDPVQAINLASIEYKIDKVSGRDTTEVQGWTVLDITGITDDTYELDITVTGVTINDSLRLLIRCTDVDGIESFHEDTEVTPI